MKKLAFILFFICTIGISCFSEQKYTIVNDWHNETVLIKNQKNETVFSITNETGKIYNCIDVVNDNLFFIDNDFCLVKVNLETKTARKILKNVGCFCFSDGKDYVCVGEIFSKDRRFYVTCKPVLYSATSFDKISLEDVDYSFLTKEDGINTYIDFFPSENKFIVSYSWETVEPMFSLELDLRTFSVKRTK